MYLLSNLLEKFTMRDKYLNKTNFLLFNVKRMYDCNLSVNIQFLLFKPLMLIAVISVIS